jgi:hypothetical protein
MKKGLLSSWLNLTVVLAKMTSKIAEIRSLASY